MAKFNSGDRTRSGVKTGLSCKPESRLEFELESLVPFSALMTVTQPATSAMSNTESKWDVKIFFCRVAGYLER